MGNRGFVELHNPVGFFIVGAGFLLVMLIVAAGGILSRMIEREHVESRRKMRESMNTDDPAAETNAVDQNSESSSDQPK